MATWQFDFHIFPRNCAAVDSGLVQLTLDREMIGAANWRDSEPIVHDLLVELAGILPNAASWSGDVQLWGQQDANAISVTRDSGSLDSIRVRIDVREIDIGFLSSMVTLCTKFDLLMLTSDGYVLSPSMTKLLAAIQKSPAFKFVSDPDSFFRRLAEVQSRSAIAEDVVVKELS